MNKAVILGTNYYIGLSLIRCLRKENVHVVACDYDFTNSYGAKSKYVSEFLKIEELNHINDSVRDQLIEYGKKQDEKPVLFPSHDKYVELIDKYYDELKEYFLIIQAPGSLNTKLMDKWILAEIAEKHGVKVPASIASTDPEVMKKAEEIGYPVIIKPVDTILFTAAFKKKVFFCETPEELKTALDKCISRNITVFVQEVIPGFDDHMITYDSYVDGDGKTTHWMTAQKQRQWPINFGASVFTIQKYIKEAVEIGRPFMEALGFRGFSEIEFKKHAKTGELYLIEINVRTTNFNNLIYKVGINMPYMAYLDVTGQKEKMGTKYIDYDTNYAFIYGKDDLASIIQYIKTKQLTLGHILKTSFGKKLAPAVWAIDDLAPWFDYNKKLIEKRFKK